MSGFRGEAPAAPAEPATPPGERTGNRPADDPAQGDAHRIGKLDTLKPTGRDVDAVRYIASMFQAMPKAERDKLIALCLDEDVCDPVDACDSAGLWTSCLEACASNPSCGDRFPAQPPSDDDAAEDAGPPPASPSWSDGCRYGSHRHQHCHRNSCPHAHTHTRPHCHNHKHCRWDGHHRN